MKWNYAPLSHEKTATMKNEGKSDYARREKADKLLREEKQPEGRDVSPLLSIRLEGSGEGTRWKEKEKQT